MSTSIPGRPEGATLAPEPDQMDAGDGRTAFGPRAPLCVRYPRGAGRDVALGDLHRPTWRGRIHQLALIAALPWCVVLLARARPGGARAAVAVYAVGLCAMFATSATYHRWVHGLRARAVWRRADHAMIFVAIAGSATPVAVVTMPGTAGLSLVIAVWAAGIIGAACKLSRAERGDAIGSWFYAVASVLSALTLPAVWMRGGVAPAVLVVISGACYIGGAVGFARCWPRLRPKVFSYHEVWHLFTVAAAGAHFAALWAIVN